MTIRRTFLRVAAVVAVLVANAVAVLPQLARAISLNNPPAPVVTLTPPVVVGPAPRTVAVSDRTIYSTAAAISGASATVVGSNTSGALLVRYTGEVICPTPAPTATPVPTPTPTPPIIIYLHGATVAHSAPRQMVLPPGGGCIYGYEVYGSFPAANLRCGTNQVQVSYFDTYASTLRRDYSTLTTLCPAISLSPNAGSAPNVAVTVTVTPTDFDGYQNDRPKVLTFDGRPVGTFGYKKPISFVASAGCGPHQVTLVQASSYGTLSASADYPVRCPTAAVTPAVIARAAEPTPVMVTAGGFPPSAAVTVAINGSPARGATTDGGGNLAAPITVANLGCAGYTVSVTTNGLYGGIHVTASAPFTVSCSALITVDPAVVSAGMTTHVVGWGFTPATAVTLQWKLADGTTIGVNGSPQIASSPTGGVDFYTLVMSTEPIGERTLVATDTKGLAAVTTIVVARGTMQPSNSGQQVQKLVTRR